MIRVYYDSVKGEDFPVIGIKTYGIIDGATPLGGSKRQLLDYIRSFSYYVLKYENAPLRESIDYALTVTNYPEYSSIEPHKIPSASAGIVRVFDDHIEVFQAEDVAVVLEVDGKIHFFTNSNIEKYDLKGWRELKKLMGEGKSFDEANNIVHKTTLREIRDRFLGKKYFPIYPGGEVSMYKFHSLPYSDSVRFAIMSDGFYRYFLLTGTALENVFEMCIESAIRELRKIEENATLSSVDFPFFKRHDDASVLVFDRKL